MVSDGGGGVAMGRVDNHVGEGGISPPPALKRTRGRDVDDANDVSGLDDGFGYHEIGDGDGGSGGGGGDRSGRDRDASTLEPPGFTTPPRRKKPYTGGYHDDGALEPMIGPLLPGVPRHGGGAVDPEMVDNLVALGFSKQVPKRGAS